MAGNSRHIALNSGVAIRGVCRPVVRGGPLKAPRLPSVERRLCKRALAVVAAVFRRSRRSAGLCSRRLSPWRACAGLGAAGHPQLPAVPSRPRLRTTRRGSVWRMRAAPENRRLTLCRLYHHHGCLGRCKTYAWPNCEVTLADFISHPLRLIGNTG